MKLTNTWTALVTPFNSDLSVDWDGLQKNAEFQISEGITGLLPAGTTGESPTLGWEEHNEVIDRVIVASREACGVLAGTGSNSTEEAVESSRHAVKSGADAVLLVDCYYNGPSSQELRDEYHGVIAAEFPNTTVVPYIIPGRTGTSLSVEDLAVLAGRYPNVNTVKEATGDLARMAKTRALCGRDFSIMSGDDDLTFPMMTDLAIEADGVISVATNVVPSGVCAMVEALHEGAVAHATNIRDALAPLLGIVTVKIDNKRTLPNGHTVMVNDRYRNPLAIKTLMNALDMPAGPCRRPLGKMSKAGVDVVRQALSTVWERSPEMLRPIAEFYGTDIARRISDDSVWNALAL
jgi:4-hydroxy-tetrahydrodipicolinate synthase